VTATATKMAVVMAKRVAGERRRRRRRDGGGRRRERWRWRRGWRASDSNEGEGDSNEGDGDGDWGGVRQRGEGEGNAEGDESGSRGGPSTQATTTPRTPPRTPTTPTTPTTPGGMRTTQPRQKQRLIRNSAGGMQKFRINKLAASDHAKRALKRATSWYAKELKKTGGLSSYQIEAKVKKEFDGVGPHAATIRRYMRRLSRKQLTRERCKCQSNSYVTLLLGVNFTLFLDPDV